ncbi:MAG: sodium:solute symporter [Saprospiraceae bacterium]|nr:sodium:solute symporter [Saprospiraceae bacterium]MBK9630897.1 sodium:solute symporter [Saprospiraceae bacterium]
MSWIDWLVLLGVLGFIAIYGWYKSRAQTGLRDFVVGDHSSNWWKVGLTVMATQASAITFISTTGQGFSDGMRFVQFYFGLPLAMWVIMYYFIPAFYRLKVMTAYEFLEQRFDLKTRLFAAFIFLIQRGLAAGITLYAPAIILSSVLGWNLAMTQVITGILVIFYTVTGGAKAVTVTQIQQMAIILLGMVFVFCFLLYSLPDSFGLVDALSLAGQAGRMEALDFNLDFNSRYNVWAGITGGFFLALAYFGTDQSQVQRYLSGKNIRESQMGLFFNGLVKIPMQIFILLCGVILFAFFQFERTPLTYNQKLNETLSTQHSSFFQNKSEAMQNVHDERISILNEKTFDPNLYARLNKEQDKLREEVRVYAESNELAKEANDRDYIFLYFILNYLPHGMIGLLLAVILCAAMSSIAAELNALAGTSSVDIKNRLFPNLGSKISELDWSRIFTIFWGLIAIAFAFYASLFENLIQFINLMGSLFYGSVLGIFLVAFFVKWIRGTAVFVAACIAQLTVLLLYVYSDIGFLWYNVIGAMMVIIIGAVIEKGRIGEN